MSRIRSFFSQIFNSDEEPEPSEAAAEERKPPVREEPPPSDPALLSLPPDHSLNRLYNMRAEQAGPLPPPKLRLNAPESLLSAEELDRELGRLRLTITTASAKRLDKSAAKPGKAGEDPPPPPVLDTQVLVFLPKNQLTAWILALPPVNGGAELTLTMLEDALHDAKVSYGVDQDLLQSLPDWPDRYFHLYMAARGHAVVHGKDGVVVDMFSRNLERTYQVNDSGQVDYATLNTVQNAEAGAVICRILPPTEGEDGRTVLDQVITAKNGHPAAVPKGRNTELSEDGSALLASRAGHVEFTGRSFEIKPLLEIGGNVDFSTGNINFLGDVHIHGDVCSGFTVQAMGSITIDGVVESCNIEAGGDLIVIKGVQGNYQAVIRSQRNVFVKYLENCSVYARGNIQADCIIQCEVFSDGVVQVRSGRGTIIGGSIRAAREVNAAIVGTKSEQPTLVVLETNPCEDFERRVLELEYAELVAEVEKVALQPESPAKLRKLSTLRMKMAVNKNKQQLLQKDKSDGTEEAPKGRLVFGVAYPGTEIVIGGVSRRLTMETQSSTAVLSEGEISFI